MQYFSGLVAALLAVVGWYINAVGKMKDRLQKLEVDMATLKATAEAHSDSMSDMKREIEDVRTNMVRRHDLEQVIDAIGKRIDDAMRRK